MGYKLLKSTFTQGATLYETAIEKNTLGKKSLLSPLFFLTLRNSHNSKSKGRITRYKKILSWAVRLLLKWSCNTIAKGTSAANTDMVGDLSLLDEKKEEKREVGRTETSNSSWTAFLSPCTNPVTIQSTSPAKTKASAPIVPMEWNMAAGLEVQSFLQALPFSWPISESWAFATHPSETLRAPKFTGGAAAATCLPGRAPRRLQDWLRGEDFDPLAVRARLFHKGKGCFLV